MTYLRSVTVNTDNATGLGATSAMRAALSWREIR